MSDELAIRQAKPEELPFLRAKLAQRERDGFEQVDLSKRTVFLADDGGIPAGLGALRLHWQIQPLMLFPEFERYAPPIRRKRAAYYLAQAMMSFLEASAENQTGIHSYFAFLHDPAFMQLAQKFGMTPDYEGQTLFRGGWE